MLPGGVLGLQGPETGRARRLAQGSFRGVLREPENLGLALYCLSRLPSSVAHVERLPDAALRERAGMSGLDFTGTVSQRGPGWGGGGSWWARESDVGGAEGAEEGPALPPHQPSGARGALGDSPAWKATLGCRGPRSRLGLHQLFGCLILGSPSPSAQRAELCPLEWGH